MSKLDDARNEINKIDREMAHLFERRMKAVRTVAEYKESVGMPVLDEAREAQIIAKNVSYINDAELQSYYVNFLKNNISISKAYQHKILEGMRVAYSGVPGAFADIAVGRIFPSANAVSYDSFKSAYDAVVNGECDCAVLPIENSYAGDVTQVMDMTFFGSLYINGIYDLEVVQNLIGLPGATVANIKKVISHPQALSQCAGYISEHGFDSIEASNTAVAAKQVCQMGRSDIAAIASKKTAQLYDLSIIEKNINESSNNTTRFAVFSRTQNKASDSDNHFILFFTVKNEAGCLGRVVSVIGENGFNLKALKSRPTKELIWEYYFYVEGEGNIYSKKAEKMFEELKDSCSTFKVVGSFEKEIILKE